MNAIIAYGNYMINNFCSAIRESHRISVGDWLLPHDASAERGYGIACRPSVCL